MADYIDRLLAPIIQNTQKFFPVTVITGPRQSGKTCLCKHLFPEFNFVNLEDITSRSNAMRDPTRFIDQLGDNVIIDEVQNVPEILSMIQVRVDEYPDRRYILTGSSNFKLLKSISQSLAGRAALFTLLPFSLSELKDRVRGETIDEIILKGLYPRVNAEGAPFSIYYRSYYNTYVERDLRDLLKIKNLVAFDKFMRLLAARIGTEFNASAIAREVGVSSVTIKEWLSILMTSYIVFPLTPYFLNVSKQLTKMPKIYFYDTGLACFLLGIKNEEELRNHYLRGALFENLAICELMKKSYNEGEEPRINFYREKSGVEVDAVIEDGRSIHLFEIKSGATLRSDFLNNMKEVASQFKCPVTNTVIFDGQSFPPTCVNIREI